MKTEGNAFKNIEAKETVPPSRRDEVITTVLTVQLFSDIVSLFTFQMAQTFSGLLSGNREKRSPALMADNEWEDDSNEMSV